VLVLVLPRELLPPLLLLPELQAFIKQKVINKIETVNPRTILVCLPYGQDFSPFRTDQIETNPTSAFPQDIFNLVLHFLIIAGYSGHPGEACPGPASRAG
jgi:hypothetical protein